MGHVEESARAVPAPPAAGLWARTATVAGRLNRTQAELVDASAALEGGKLTLDQVAVITRGVPTGHQASVTALAREGHEPPGDRERHA